MELACQMRSNSCQNIEELNVTISQEGDDYYLDGRLPWVTNLRSDKFAALFAADFKDGSQPWIITIPSEAEGLSRSEDLEFVSLQGANTASLTFDHVKLDPNWVLSKEGTDYIAKTRPNFLWFPIWSCLWFGQVLLMRLKLV